MDINLTHQDSADGATNLPETRFRDLREPASKILPAYNRAA